MTIPAFHQFRRAALDFVDRCAPGEGIYDEGVLQSRPGEPFTHCFNSVPTLSPGDAGNLLDQSFYLWAVIAACSVVKASDDPQLQAFLNHPWPRTPSHWLWVPG